MARMRVRNTEYAGPWARFAADAFAGAVGSTVPVKLDGQATGWTGTLVSAEVAADGRSAKMTYELDGPADDPGLPPSVFGYSVDGGDWPPG